MHIMARRALRRAVWGALAFVALLLAVGWESDRPVDQLRVRWAPPPSQFIDLQGMRVHLRDQGPADDSIPLLLHGTSASLHTWEGWEAGLADDERIISVDLPGFGLTGPDPDRDYRIERYVGFVQALLDHLRIERATIAGNSLGGWIAWETALAHPNRVHGLVLVDPAGYGSAPEEIPLGFRLARHQWLRPLLESLLPRSLVQRSVEQVYGDPARVSTELVDRYFELSLREGNRQALFDRFNQGLGSPDNRRRTAGITQPTLIIWGSEDRLIPTADAARFAADIASSELAMLPGLGHVPHEEDPAATLAVLRPFLRQIEPPPSTEVGTDDREPEIHRDPGRDPGAEIRDTQQIWPTPVHF
jgi:pimeloyl-ACP methyl ester carboxylesterase